jgi:hypothetical protein
MRLARGHEALLHADVQLLVLPDRKPDAAALAQRLRLLQLGQAQQLAEEAPGLLLAPGRCGELDVIEAGD